MTTYTADAVTTDALVADAIGAEQRFLYAMIDDDVRRDLFAADSEVADDIASADMFAARSGVAVSNDGTITGIATCACGAMYFATEREADMLRIPTATGTTSAHCRFCDTRATDHGFVGDERCFECDGRSWSHR